MFLNSELPYQGEAILRNGTTTTTASIPFALGLSVPDSLYSPSGTSKGLLIGGTGPGANSTYYGQGTLELVDYNFLGTKLRYVLFGSSAVTSGPGLGFLASAGSTSASTQPGGNLRFTGGNNTDGVTGGSGGNVTFVAGAGRGATYKGGVVELVGGTASASATYGYISIGNTTFGTPDKINLTSSDAFKSLYVNKHLEVDGTTYLDGALNVVGTTTLATSLTGILKATSGVVATASSSDLITAIGNAKADGSTKGVATFTAADFDDNGSGLISYDYATNKTWTGTQYVNLSSTSALKVGSIPTLQVDTTNVLVGQGNAPLTSGLLGTATSQVFGGSNPRLTLIANDNSASTAPGVQAYRSSAAGGSSDFIGGFLYYQPANIMSFYGPSTTAALAIDSNRNTQWGGYVTVSTAALAAMQANATTDKTLLIKQLAAQTGLLIDVQGSAGNSILGLDGVNSSIGIRQAPTSANVIGITDTQATRVTGHNGISLTQTYSWTTGAAVNTGDNGLLFTLNDNHVADSGFTDTIRNFFIALNRGAAFASLANTNNMHTQLISLTDSGTYYRTAGNQTVNAISGNYSGSFSPIYNDTTGTRALTYNASGFVYSGVYFPTLTAGASITGNLRGFYVSSLSGATGTGLTTNVTGVEVTSINTGTTVTGMKVTSVSGGTTSIGYHMASIASGTTSYGVKIDTVAGTTTAIGLGITAVPTTATSKYQVALDGTGTGSGIYFNTPTAAGTEYIRVASSGILESSYATTYRIKEPTTSTYPLQINSTGQVAISTNNSPATYLKLYVQDKSTDPASGLKYAFSAVQEVQPTGTWTGSNQGGFSGGVRYVATQDFNNGSTLIGLEGSAVVYVGAGKTVQSANAIFANSTARGNGGGGGTVSTFSLYGIYMTVDQATISNLYDYRTYDAPLSNGGAVTNQYGYYAAEMTAATNNYEIFLATAGGIFFRDGNQYIDSSAANTLRHAANTTQLFNIGGTTEITLTGTQLDLMSANTDRVNFIGGSDGGAATTAGGAPTFTDYYGGNTKAMGDPIGWLNVKINGTARKIPYY